VLNIDKQGGISTQINDIYNNCVADERSRRWSMARVHRQLETLLASEMRRDDARLQLKTVANLVER
jgi:hypothetical protein